MTWQENYGIHPVYTKKPMLKKLWNKIKNKIERLQIEAGDFRSRLTEMQHGYQEKAKAEAWREFCKVMMARGPGLVHHGASADWND